MTTSIDSLAPDCPIFPLLHRVPRAPWTRYHNIVGVVPRRTLLGRVTEEGDGVVSYRSAHLEYAHSEIIVPADHMTVHRHPLAILEVRRILLEHLASLTQPQLAWPVMAPGHQLPGPPPALPPLPLVTQ
jgi:hypothetical protein